jgi:hypothetical protein
MGERWLPYAAAALATGGCALIMGALTLPSSRNGSELLSTLQAEPDRSLLASAAFVYAAFALTVGIPTFFALLRPRGRITGQVGAVVFAFGTIGLAGYAALLILFRALTQHAVVEAREIDLLSRDSGLLAFVGAFVVAFEVGVAMLAIALFRARTVQRWIPALMLAHAVTLPFVRGVPEELQSMHTLLVGVALIGAAVSANESWAGMPRRSPR